MTESDIKRYYSHQALYGAGAQPTFYRAPVFFRGHGAFSNIMTSLLTHSKPLLKTAGKYIAKKGVKALGGVTKDVIDGVNLKSALKRNASKAFESAKDDTASFLRKKMQYSPAAAKKHPRKKNVKPRKKKTKRGSKRRRLAGYL